MQRNFCGELRSNPTTRSSAIKVVNRPFALGTTSFDEKNRATP